MMVLSHSHNLRGGIKQGVMEAILDYDLPVQGTPSSNPRSYLSSSDVFQKSIEYLQQNNLQSAISSGFHLASNDNYVYHAIASVTLSQVQDAVNAGTVNGLCDWYPNAKGLSLGHPGLDDITAYTSIFSPKTSIPANTLKSFKANAKKESLRLSIADNLLEKRYASETLPAIPKPTKAMIKKPLFNPYYDFWVWSCHALHWAGPGPNTTKVKTSHAVLPIFMHHFGCVVPSREALELIKMVSFDGNKQPSHIIDMGSGNGYWTYVLRGMNLPVIAVDNQQSVFRCNWISDTIIKDGAAYLKGRKGASEDVLLLIYPVVAADFFQSMLDTFKGTRLVVVGTQCRNGYTAFRHELVDEWIASNRPKWTLLARLPLPSFPGKDEAIYYFRKMD